MSRPLCKSATGRGRSADKTVRKSGL
jgi:hypothetical protein